MLDFLRIGSKEKLTEGKRKIKIKYFSFVEYIILGFIIFTSMGGWGTGFITIPIFLTVVFVLIQIKKYIAFTINKPSFSKEKMRELIREEIKKNG